MWKFAKGKRWRWKKYKDYSKKAEDSRRWSREYYYRQISKPTKPTVKLKKYDWDRT